MALAASLYSAQGVFERLVGRNAAHPLLGVEQIISLGEGDGRTTVRARYDVLDDLSLIGHESGSACCGESTTAVEVDTRGFIGLGVATHRGNLAVEQFTT